jgi:hypothetical protein
MKRIVFLLIVLFHLNTNAQQIDLNFVLIAEVNTTECDKVENAFFITQVLNTKVDNLMERHKVFEFIKSNYMDFVDDIVKNQYPEYSLPECSSDVSNWRFFEEWNISPENFKEYVDQKYSLGRIIEVEFTLQTAANTIYVEEKKEEIDPNQALIDAFYSQALSEFEAKNFRKTLIVLEKAKELVAPDKVNLNLMLLEAKTKSVVDKNVNETKDLLNQFVKEAAKQNFEKLSEGANLLVALETSDLYYQTGFKKEFTNIIETADDVLTCKETLDKNGNVVFSSQLSENWNNTLFKEIDNSIANEQKIVNYTKSNVVESVEYYKNAKLLIVVYPSKRKVDYYDNGSLAQSVIYSQDDEDTVDITVFNKSGKTAFIIDKVKLIDKFPVDLSRDLKFEALNNFGKVKQIKESLEKEEFNIYDFSLSGMPVEKLYYKKGGKLKDKFEFDNGTSTWIEVK